MLAGQHNNQKRDHQQHATGNDAAADPPAWRGQTPALQPVSVVWQHILQLSHAFSLGLLAQRGKRHCLTTRNGTQTVVRSNAQSNTNSTLRIVHCYVASQHITPTRMCAMHKKSRSCNVMTPWSVDPNHWMIHLGWRKCMGVACCTPPALNWRQPIRNQHSRLWCVQKCLTHPNGFFFLSPFSLKRSRIRSQRCRL